MPLFQSSWVLWSKYPLWRQPSNLMKGDQQVIFFSVSQVFLKEKSKLQDCCDLYLFKWRWQDPDPHRQRVIFHGITRWAPIDWGSSFLRFQQDPCSRLWACTRRGNASWTVATVTKEIIWTYDLWPTNPLDSRSSSLSLSLSISAWRFERFRKSSWYSWHLASLWLQYV